MDMDIYSYLKYGEKFDADYIEIRSENIIKNHIDLKDGVFHTFTTRRSMGYGIRILKDGAWGFASITSNRDVKKAIEDAYRMARSSSRGRKDKIELADVKVTKDRVKSNMKIKPEDVGIEEKVERIKKLERIFKKNKIVASSIISYEDSYGKKHLLTSEGMDIEWDVNYIWQYIWLTGKKDGVFASARDEIGSVDYGWEIFERENNDKIEKRVIKKLNSQLKGISPKRGEYSIIASPIIVGIIAHEALGHLAEGDLTVNSPFLNLIGKKIAPEYVNMSDRIIDGGFGNNIYDDEGTKVRDVHIIKNGILTEIMVNREYAKRFNMEPNGHARAENYTFPPIIRMRNTVFEKGEQSFEEMIEDIKFGYYVVDFRGGQAELNSSFQVGVQEGYVIRNGEIGESIRDTSISGIAIDALKNIKMVGKDFGLEMGRCGKGQTAFVSSGGPHMRFDRGIVIGGQR